MDGGLEQGQSAFPRLACLGSRRLAGGECPSMLEGPRRIANGRDYRFWLSVCCNHSSTEKSLPEFCPAGPETG
jgi:hypothetical protein